jgi:hypothetical protein
MRRRPFLITLVFVTGCIAIGVAGWLTRHQDESPIAEIITMTIPIPPGSRLIEECFLDYSCKASFTTPATYEEVVSFYAKVFTPPTWNRCAGGCILSGCVPVAVGYQQPNTYNTLDILITESDTLGWQNVFLVIPNVESTGEVYAEIIVDC